MRALRDFLPGHPVHVIHRGNNHQPIFTCNGDFLLFRRVLDEACRKEAVGIHAYVLMTNHVHLLMTPEDKWGISRALQSAIRRYVGYFNARYGRSGTLWDGRFWSSVLRSDRYLFTCHRYIDLNPVRARMVATPEEYPWSSHRHYAWGEPDTMLSPHPAIAEMSADPARRADAYRHLFDEPLSRDDLDTIRRAARSGRCLGLAPPGRRRGRPRKNGV